MEANQISIVLDTKLDVHDKLKFKQWTECQVKIEAVKCLPCFLRITFTPTSSSHNENKHEKHGRDPSKSVSISINVPGVTVSLASSRTRQHSFGIFWTQSRKNCYIYFAPETELTCKRLMKWMKKSMKNLELYRQLVLEQRRHSRGPTQGQIKKYTHDLKTLEVLTMDSICSYTSGIYEEIPDHEIKSRDSIASGIYEEMKPPTSSSKITIEKTTNDVAPPLPPLPPQRKRINTFETNLKIGALPRCNTNPESEAIKKKKYKNMFDNLFGVARAKRAESVSETQATSIDDVINCASPKRAAVAKKEKQMSLEAKQHKRNSFSSPDLSKINLLQFDENDEKTVDFLNNSFSICQDLTFGGKKNETETIVSKEVTKMRRESLTSLNVSAQIPFNFNFSACNTSKLNLVGSNVANVGNENLKVPIDDMTGYCLMAPIMPQKVETSSKSDDNSEYVNMQNSLKNANCSISPSVLTGSHLNHHLYENLITLKATQELENLQVLNAEELGSTSTPTEVTSTLQTVEEENFYQTPRKSIISVDDKIPSYYPNENVKGRRSSRSPLSERILLASANEILPAENAAKPKLPAKRNGKLKRQEHVKIDSLKETKPKQKKPIVAAQKISENVYAVSRKSKADKQKNVDKTVNVDLLPKIDFRFDDIKLLVNNNNKAVEENLLRSPIEKNVARATRAASTNTPERYRDNIEILTNNSTNIKNIIGNESYAAHFMHMTGIKKYASLPRLKKIDFSPLKMKINNVLQRQFTPPREIEQDLPSN